MLLAANRGKILSGQHHCGGVIGNGDQFAIRFGHFIRVAWTNDLHARDGPASGEMLDRLMRRAIFAQPDRVVRENVQHRLVHDAGQTHRRAHVIREDEERSAVWPQSGQRQSIADRRHRMFANAKMKIASAVGIGTELAELVTLHHGVIRGRQIRRAADEPREVLANRVQQLA
jgi:hypothetical protein